MRLLQFHYRSNLTNNENCALRQCRIQLQASRCKGIYTCLHGDTLCYCCPDSESVYLASKHQKRQTGRVILTISNQNHTITLETWNTMYELPCAAMTKYHRSGGFNNRNLYPHSSGGYESNILVSAGLVYSEAPVLGLQVAVFSLCLHTVFLLCMSVS